MRLEGEKKKRQKPPFPTRQTKRPKKPPSRERETDRLKEVDSKRVRDRRKGRRGEERWSAKK